MIKRASGIPPQETLPVSCLLAFTGGYLDAYSYILRGGVFANAQTGNIVLLSVSVAYGRFWPALYYSIPVLAFFIGVALTEWLRRRAHRSTLDWSCRVLLLEILLLALSGILPKGPIDPLVNIIISFVCALQFNTFRKVEGCAYASTMCTGNLRAGTELFSQLIFDRDRSCAHACVVYAVVMVVFCVGVVAGAYLTPLLHESAVWICCLCLGGAFALCIKTQLPEPK